MEGERPGVILALTPLVERAIEPLLHGKAAVLTVLASASDADELMRVARESAARTALLSSDLSGLSTAHCERLRAEGLRLVGVALDEHDEHALKSLSVQSVVLHNIEPQELLEIVHEQHTPVQLPTAPVMQRPSPGVDDASGVVLAVVGCKGAPGASECAASLATLAASRWPALLAELDMLGGGLDVRMGADAHEGSLLGLVRAAAAGEATRELLGRWLMRSPHWPPVLLAPRDPDEALGELSQPAAIASALNALRANALFTVCDVGFLLAGGEEVSPPARVHREALVSADVVLLVLGPRETQQRAGFAQIRMLTEQLAIPPQRLRVAVNGIGAPGAASHTAVKNTLDRRLAAHGLAVDAWLPWDERALSRAHRHGRPLLSTRPRSRYAKAAAGLLEEMFQGAGTVRARRPRLAMPYPPRKRSEKEEVTLPWRT